MQTDARLPGEAIPPRRRLWTQCIAVLFDQAPELTLLRACLGAFNVMDERGGVDGPFGWATLGPSLDLAFRPEVHGRATIDVVDAPWPDDMGTPSGPDSFVFASWALGHFGPSSYPGNFERALQHARRWPAARDVAPRHRAFVRIRTTYATGAPLDGRLPVDGYDAIAELRFVTDVARALLAAPGALCVFNPNGETPSTTRRMISRARYGVPTPRARR